MFSAQQSTFETVVRAHAAGLYRFAVWLCRDRQLGLASGSSPFAETSTYVDDADAGESTDHHLRR